MKKHTEALEELIDRILLENEDLFLLVEEPQKKVDIALSSLTWAMSEYCFSIAIEALKKELDLYFDNKDNFNFDMYFKTGDSARTINEVLKEIKNIGVFWSQISKEEFSEIVESSNREDNYERIKEASIQQMETIALNTEVKKASEIFTNNLPKFFDINNPAISSISPYLFSAFAVNLLSKENRFNKQMEANYRKKGCGDPVDNKCRNNKYIVEKYFNYDTPEQTKEVNPKTHLPQKNEMLNKFHSLISFVRFFGCMDNFNYTFSALLFEKRTGLLKLRFTPQEYNSYFPYAYVYIDPVNNTSVTLAEVSTMYEVYYRILNNKSLCEKAYNHISDLDLLHGVFEKLFASEEEIDKFFYRFCPEYKANAFYNCSYYKNELDIDKKKVREEMWWNNSLDIVDRLVLDRQGDGESAK